jgi:hypothetical protein
MNSKRPRWTGMWHAREKTVMRIGLRWGNLKEGDFLEYLDIDGGITLKQVFKIGLMSLQCIQVTEDKDKW